MDELVTIPFRPSWRGKTWQLLRDEPQQIDTPTPPRPRFPTIVRRVWLAHGEVANGTMRDAQIVARLPGYSYIASESPGAESVANPVIIKFRRGLMTFVQQRRSGNQYGGGVVDDGWFSEDNRQITGFVRGKPAAWVTLAVFTGFVMYEGTQHEIAFNVNATAGIEFNGIFYVGDASGRIWVFDPNAKVFFLEFAAPEGGQVADFAVLDGVLVAAIGNLLYTRSEAGIWSPVREFQTPILDLEVCNEALYAITAHIVSILADGEWTDIEFPDDALREAVVVGDAVWVFGDGGVVIVFDGSHPLGDRQVAPLLADETITAAIYDPNSGTVYVGAQDGSIYTWTAEDGWTLLSERGAEVRDLIVFQGLLFVLLPHGYDIYDPLAQTWTQEAFTPLDRPTITIKIGGVDFDYSVEGLEFLFVCDGATLEAIAVTFDGYTFYALVGAALYRSDDAGATWEMVSVALSPSPDVALDPVALAAGNGIVYAVFNRSDGAVVVALWDGLEWTYVVADGCVAVGAGLVNGALVVALADGRLLALRDGVLDPAAIPELLGVSLIGAASNGKAFFAVTNDGEVWVWDGRRWTLLATRTASPLAVVWTDVGLMLVYADHIEVWDGDNWAITPIVTSLWGNVWILFDADLYVGTSADVQLAARDVSGALVSVYTYPREVIGGVVTADVPPSRPTPLRALYRAGGGPPTQWKTYTHKAELCQPVAFAAPAREIWTAIYRTSDDPEFQFANVTFCPQFADGDGIIVEASA